LISTVEGERFNGGSRTDPPCARASDLARREEVSFGPQPAGTPPGEEGAGSSSAGRRGIGGRAFEESVWRGRRMWVARIPPCVSWRIAEEGAGSAKPPPAARGREGRGSRQRSRGVARSIVRRTQSPRQPHRGRAAARRGRGKMRPRNRLAPRPTSRGGAAASASGGREGRARGQCRGRLALAAGAFHASIPGPKPRTSWRTRRVADWRTSPRGGKRFAGGGGARPTKRNHTTSARWRGGAGRAAREGGGTV